MVYLIGQHGNANRKILSKDGPGAWLKTSGGIMVSKRRKASSTTLRTAFSAWCLVAIFAASAVLRSGSHEVAGPATAGQSEDPDAAYVRGDFATALRLWRPMADL